MATKTGWANTTRHDIRLRRVRLAGVTRTSFRKMHDLNLLHPPLRKKTRLKAYRSKKQRALLHSFREALQWTGYHIFSYSES